ncbi:hypothetical protein ACFSCZ_13435 [Siminovitchia sediminis]|uniref:TMhelix containing protein n=1 Tax=Siminovitchia sediminis TaxID=1274353 RepID=A0ABW4KK74_9BACI
MELVKKTCIDVNSLEDDKMSEFVLFSFILIVIGIADMLISEVEEWV